MLISTVARRGLGFGPLRLRLPMLASDSDPAMATGRSHPAAVAAGAVASPATRRSYSTNGLVGHARPT